MNTDIKCIKSSLPPGASYFATTEPYNKQRIVYSVSISCVGTGQTMRTYGKLTHTQATAFIKEFNQCP